MDIWYTWIHRQSKFFHQLSKVIWTFFICHFFYSLEGDILNAGGGGGYRYFIQLRASLFRAHENLVQHPSNILSITILVNLPIYIIVTQW